MKLARRPQPLLPKRNRNVVYQTPSNPICNFMLGCVFATVLLSVGYYSRGRSDTETTPRAQSHEDQGHDHMGRGASRLTAGTDFAQGHWSERRHSRFHVNKGDENSRLSSEALAVPTARSKSWTKLPHEGEFQTWPVPPGTRLVNDLDTSPEVRSCLETPSPVPLGQKEAYITFLTGNQPGYISGVLAMNHNLKVMKSTRPLVVMHLNDVPAEELAYLHMANIRTHEVSGLPNPNCKGDKGRPCHRGRDNYSKLHAFGLVEYKTLVYLDCDMVIRFNIDELFCYSAFTACRISTCVGDCHKINSGILVLQPNQKIYDDMLSKYKTFRSFNSGDQGFLTTYYEMPEAPAKHFLNGKIYNTKIKSTDKRNCDAEMNDDMIAKDGHFAKVMHFMDATKPWVFYKGRERVGSVYDNANTCFKFGLDMWATHYHAVLDKFEGLEEYLVRTMATNIPDWKAKEATEVRQLGESKAMDQRSNAHLGAELVTVSGEGLNSSVVIMNWKRPQNVKQMLETIVKYQAVTEILVWHCNPDTVFEYNHPKVRMINDPAANTKFGLNVRFKGCLETKYDTVLTLDDDVLPTENTVNTLLRAKQADPDRLHSLHGRDPYEGCVYNFRQAAQGPAALVLTKILATDRRFCRETFKYTHLMEEFVQKATPYWNGEDIFHSLVSTKITGNKPYRHDLKYERLPSQGEGISNHNLREHKDYRTELLRESTKQLQLPCESL